jgi:Clostripain family/Putative Ig domain/Dockerin type I domain
MGHTVISYYQQGGKMGSKKILIIVSILLLSLCLTSTASAEKKWTIMVYCCADNNLDWAGVNDLNELELSGSSDDINIIFLLDRWGSGDTHLYYVLNDPNGLPYGDDNNTISTIIDDTAPWLAVEEDMGNPATLSDFVLWTLENYPAEHYLLSIWDHGSGIFKNGDYNFITKGECWDDNGGNPDDYIDLAEFKSVIASASATIGRKLDIIGHDVCLAGQYETHYQVRDYANISIASADNEPFDGWDYEGPFINLKNNPDMSPEELSSQIVQYYYDWYGPDPGCCNTQAAVDLRIMQSDFMPVFEQFNQLLIDNFNDYMFDLMSSRVNCATYNQPNFDYWQYVEEVASNTNLPQNLRDVAATLLEKLDLMFINNLTADYTAGTGCTIWFPNNYSKNSDVDDYKSKIDFANTNWSRFLRVFAHEFIINTTELAEGYIDTPYYQEFSAFNGTPPYHWEKVVGQLPYGLSFTDGDTAFISGTPTYVASFSFTLKVTDSSEPPREDSRYYTIFVNPPPPMHGDADRSGSIDITDAVFLVNYIFLEGEQPDPIMCGDANCDDKVNLVDIIYLVNYIFRGGQPPCQE